MKFGVCGKLENAPVFQENGFDYFELNFSEWAEAEEEKIREAQNRVETAGFYPEAMNVMLPGTFRIIEKENNIASFQDYLKRGFDHAARLHTEIVAFGSGRARSMPEGFSDRAQAYERLEAFLKLAGEIAASYHIKIAVEPLSFRESNMINLVGEAVYLASRVALDNVCCLADYYHIASNGESCKSVSAFSEWVGHCHIACPNNRTCPLPGVWDYSPFFDALKESGYQERISIECGETNWEKEAGRALDFLKSCVKNQRAV